MEPSSAHIASIDATLAAVREHLGVTFLVEVGEFGCVEWTTVRLRSGVEVTLGRSGAGPIEVWGPFGADVPSLAAEFGLPLRAVA